MKFSFPVVAGIFCMSLFFLVFPKIASAQSTPFLSDSEISMILNDLSGDRAFEHIRWLTHWHRGSGMEGFFKAADYIVKSANEAGLETVRFIEQPLPGPNYTARSAELWIIDPIELKLADIGDHALYLADGSHDADTTAELVWIGDASSESLKGLDVAGKIVLTNGQPREAVENAVWGKGAIGVVSYVVAEGKSPLDYPDQIAWRRIPIQPPEGQKGTFAFMLPARKGERLRKMLTSSEEKDFFATGKPVPGGRVVLRVKVDTEIGEAPGRTGFVEGWIHGTRYHDQQIVITAHLQEEQGSANDDGSGCANLLEQARVFNKLIAEGRMKLPLRDIRFWWTDEIYSEYRYFEDHPGEPGKLLVNLHQDMTGARQSLGSRVQHLIFAPHSRTSYLDALLESIGTYIIQTNNSYLSAGRAGGLPRPHSRPIYSTRGTHEGYHAAFVPYFGHSDYRCFVDGAIGVPAIALINWDDDFIHSSDDDLDKIDQTQLRRNNFLISAMAYFLAFADETDVPLIAGETFAQGNRRLAKAFTVAIRLLESWKKPASHCWKEASMVIEQSIQREVRALNSVRIFAGTDARGLRLIESLIERIRRKEKEMILDLKRYYRQIHGSNPKHPELMLEEREATRKIPIYATPLKTYFSNRGEIDYQGKLHRIMQEEVFNFVDGKRSYYDIYKAVHAEALIEGEWYYGRVTLEDVVKLLDAAVETGALRIQ